MTLKDKKKLKAILDLLGSQSFYDFYAKENGEFDMYIANLLKYPKMKAEVEEKLIKMFKDIK